MVKRDIAGLPRRAGGRGGRVIAVRAVSPSVAALLLAACQPGGGEQGSAPRQAAEAVIPEPDSTEAYAGIAASETVRLVGTEPFWGGQVAGTALTYTTPEHPAGTTIAVERFAGRGGVAFSGSLAGAALELAVTAAACSDGMSDRSYPFTVTLRIGDDTRSGCGWSERQPFAGPQAP